MYQLAVVIMAIMITGGCSDSKRVDKSAAPAASPAPPPAKQSNTKDIIGGLTGKSAVKAGEKAKTQINAISADHNKKLKEVLDDK